MKYRESAFTLLELLTCMALIALLAGLLLPRVHAVKHQARSLECATNLRQWGLATHLFAQDNDDFLPPDGAPNGSSLHAGWYVDLPRTLGAPPYHEMPWRTNAALPVGRSLWICPTNRRRSNGHNLFHYCLNRQVNASGVGNQVRLTHIPHPARVVWLFDNGKQAGVAEQNNVHTNLHQQGAQFLFLDGHTRIFSSRIFWDFDRQRGKTNVPDLQWIP